MVWEDKKEELEKYINIDKLSYEAIGRIYKCTGVNIKKVAKKLGIDLPKRREINPNETFNKGNFNVSKCNYCGKVFRTYPSSKGLFCSIECCAKYRHERNYQRLIDGDETLMRANYTPSKYRDLILKEQDNKCAICGCVTEHNGKPLVFVVDHIDGDAANNKRDNLRCICPNCDSQLDTYKSKNKNGARHYYRYHKQKE